MNPKVIKLKEERRKNCDKIASLQARNKKIDEDIISIENMTSSAWFVKTVCRLICCLS